MNSDGSPSADRPSESEPVDAAAVFAALGDETARTLLRHLDGPVSAQQLAERCDVPVNTVYRRLRRLAATPLVEERVAIREDGRHVGRYVRRFSGVRVDVAPNGSLSVSLRRREDGPRESGQREAGRPKQ